jgi:hypothetical protein
LHRTLGETNKTTSPRGKIILISYEGDSYNRLRRAGICSRSASIVMKTGLAIRAIRIDVFHPRRSLTIKRHKQICYCE